MSKIMGLGLCLLVVTAAVVFLLKGGHVDVGERAGEIANWFMSRDEPR